MNRRDFIKSIPLIGALPFIGLPEIKLEESQEITKAVDLGYSSGDCNGIARWDGRAWTPLLGPANAYPLAIEDNGTLYASGDFTRI